MQKTNSTDYKTPGSERGSATFALCGVVVALGLVFVASLAIARAARERSEAQSAADAVALAGAGSGRAVANRVAEANRVEIVEWTESVDAVQVVVALGKADAGSAGGYDQTASARAERTERAGPVTIDVWIPLEPPPEGP
jgi:hypothetical protein